MASMASRTTCFCVFGTGTGGLTVPGNIQRRAQFHLSSDHRVSGICKTLYTTCDIFGSFLSRAYRDEPWWCYKANSGSTAGTVKNDGVSPTPMFYALLYAVFATFFASTLAQNKLPPIVVPKSGDVWNAGERQTVKWSTDGFNVYDPSLKPLPGIIYIGHLTESEQQIWFNAPLAQNFTLPEAQVDIIVPALPTAKNYFLVLFGSSDNWSQFFTINNPADPRGTGTFGTTITVTPAPRTTSANSTSSSTPQSGSGSSSSSSVTVSGVSASTTAPPASTSNSIPVGSSSSPFPSPSATAPSASASATVLTGTSSTPSPTGGAGNSAKGHGANTLCMTVVVALGMLCSL